MQTITLGSSGRETTRLGFGCSSVMGALGRKDSLMMLEAAFDAGIRHFDVAPLYGYGEAEECLGEFLGRHKGQATVATKFGMAPESGRSVKSLVRGLARPVLKLLPGLKARLQGAAAASAGEVARPVFNVANAHAALDRSLQALQVDRIDVWLLHEATAADLVHDSLLRLLEDLVASGKIGTFGVGSGRDEIPALLAERAAYCPVVQYEWSVLDALIAPGESFRMHHRALTENFRALHAALAADAGRAKRWSDACGANLADAEVLARLMLKASLICNPESVILFSSKRPAHIRNNAALVDDRAAEQQALQLYALVRAEAVAGMEVAR